MSADSAPRAGLELELSRAEAEREGKAEALQWTIL